MKHAAPVVFALAATTAGALPEAVCASPAPSPVSTRSAPLERAVETDELHNEIGAGLQDGPDKAEKACTQSAGGARAGDEGARPPPRSPFQQLYDAHICVDRSLEVKMARDDRDPSPDETDIASVTWWVRTLIWLIATVLGLVFAWVQLKNLKYGKMVEGINANIMRQVLLAIYYLCWVQGAPFDLRIQELVYVGEKSSRRLSKVAVGLILLFGAIAALLLWASGDDRKFVTMLGLFFVFNVLGFAYILWFVRPFITRSRSQYEGSKRYFSLLRLEFVEAYMCGVWQWLRFLAGSVIIVTAITACFYDPVRQEIATFGANTFGAPQLVNAVADLVPNLLLAAFILVMEIWIWFMRLRVKLQLRTVGVIADRYSIEPRQG